jgi:hypothetical protein
MYVPIVTNQEPQIKYSKSIIRDNLAKMVGFILVGLERKIGRDEENRKPLEEFSAE